MVASDQVLNAGVHSPSILQPLPKESARRKRLYVPPLWRMPEVPISVALKLFAFLFRTGAIIEHEPAPGCGREPEWLNAPTVEQRIWAHRGIAGGLMFAKGAGLPDAVIGQFITLAVAFLVIFGLGISVLVMIKRWRDQPAPKPPSASEELAKFESLLAEGEISKEEYEKIKNSLLKQLRRELTVPDTAAQDTTESSARKPGSPGDNDASA
jgi:uncharacterized membrane protein